MNRLSRIVLVAPFALAGALSVMALGACDESKGAPDEKVVDKATEGKADQWSAADNPAIFTPDLKLTLADLPLEGEAANIPWAASYWPVYEDSIAYRWDGPTSDSPAAKYGKAFNVVDAELKVSKNHGIEKYSTRKACKLDSECDANIGEGCAKRPGKDSGYCIPTWWGICHAWGPASILEPEPQHAVTKNGVTFKVNDIKALVELSYDKSTSKFVSLRCEKDEGQNKITYDAYGRPIASDSACKDTNPGTYHVLLTNYLGLRAQAFVEDRTFDDEVWNQPLRGYRITQQLEVSAQDANRLVGVTAPPSELDVKTFSGTDLAAGAWLHQPAYTVIPGTTVKVEMTGDAHDVDLYVKAGAQPTDAVYDCRPYTGTSTETCEVLVPAGVTQLFVSAMAYSGPAKFDVKVSIPKTATSIPTKYLFNDKAAKLFHVKLEVDYISEASSETDGNLAANIDHYTRTDRYEYILEVDKDGKVNGGEWIGAAKRAHPDFLWLPTGRSTTTVAGGAISYANVKALLDASVAPENPTGGNPNDNALVEAQVTVAANEWKHLGPYTDVGSGFSVVMTGTGDADLYVKMGAQPTTSAYDCRPYAGSSEETCTATAAGSYYVSVHGYKASNVKLTIRYTKVGAAPPTTPPVAIKHLDVTGSVALGAMVDYTLDVKGGKPVVVRTTAPADIDLYVRMTLPPTTSVYDQRGYTSSGNETVTLVPANDGVLHITVHGYKAATYTLKTADQ
ncbi:MAG: pre-peptidase C-terminal domain-containing protein [Myxococcota bacterium]